MKAHDDSDMDRLIRRLESMHRALRAGPPTHASDARVAESIASVLRELHGIAARGQGMAAESPRLRLVDRASPEGGTRLH